MAPARQSLAARRRSSAISKPAVMEVSPAAEKVIREKCKSLFVSALKEAVLVDDLNAASLGRAIEETIYAANGANVSTLYKASIRSHIFNLKDKRNNLRNRLLEGDLTPERFAKMSAKDMASADQNEEDERLRKESLQRTILSADNLPNNILEVKMKDGRERGKWGVTSSAAAIDYFE
ncbi:transcription factor S-II, central domain-containing protein [Lipomyces arxii]|uniref:transcription factor S-II, central domain-containing protein n=1 Tax=Lipomyces arxii TaxID=56418 RepID=UPI0034CD7368